MDILRIITFVVIFISILGCGEGASNRGDLRNYQPVSIQELKDNKEAFPVGSKLELVGVPEKVARKWSTMRDDGLDWVDAFPSGNVYFLKPIVGRKCCGVLIHAKTDNLFSPTRVQGEWQKKKFGGADIYFLEVEESAVPKGWN